MVQPSFNGAVIDFLKILRSFEEFIFEAATWLIFYPVTMWRVLRRPLQTMAYSDAEQSEDNEHRYDDTLSPPLLLLITLLIGSAITAIAHIATPEATSSGLRLVLASPQNTLMFRAILFSLIPLIAATSLLHRQKKALSRESLRPPFYAQCYLAAPCALIVTAGNDIFFRPDLPNAVGAAIMLAGGTWFLVVQTLWFRRKLDVAYGAAAWIAVWGALRALAAMFVVLLAVGLS
jgi:hypothetical protein